ncbi:MAG: hypothetical protein GEU79_13100 [Acidimicrobiia bacterium]|nr:hypothetical protein [Acidimicrobiia bacterium]
MTEITISEAAEVLGVTPRQVQRLVSSGSLQTTPTFGATTRLDATSVQALARTRPGPGRPWSPEVAWGTLWMLSGLRAPWLRPHQHSRIRKRLANITAMNVVVATRQRATTARFHASPPVVTALRQKVARTGVSASTQEESNGGKLDGYLSENSLQDVLATFPLTRERDGNVTFRISEFATERIGEEVPQAVVAVDLASSSSPRERSAGLILLDDLLPRSERRTWVTADETAKAIARELRLEDEDFALRLVARAVADLRTLDDPADIARFLVEPEGTGDRRWDTLLATAIGRECRLLGVDAPTWTEPSPLQSWWFPLLADPILMARTMTRTPIDYSTRGIWIEANALETV